MSDYPENEKMSAVKDESQAIGEFVEFGGYTLCKWREPGNNGLPQYVWNTGREKDRPPTWDDYLANRAFENPDYESWGGAFEAVGEPIQSVLARYFEIDLDKIEAEKRAMPDAMRAANAPAKTPAEIAQEARIAEMQAGNENALEHLREAEKHGIA